MQVGREEGKHAGPGVFCTPVCCSTRSTNVAISVLMFSAVEVTPEALRVGDHRYSRNSYFSSINKKTSQLHQLHGTEDHQYPPSLTQPSSVGAMGCSVQPATLELL